MLIRSGSRRHSSQMSLVNLAVLLKPPGTKGSRASTFSFSHDYGCYCAAHSIQLGGHAPTEAVQEGSQSGWRLDHAAERAGRATRAQHVGVIEAVAPARAEATSVISLSAGVDPARSIAQAGCFRTSWGRPRDRTKVAGRNSPALATSRWFVKDDADTVGIALC